MKCDRCGGARLVPIVHGMPTEELAARAERGLVALGGCFEMPAVRRCLSCEASWCGRGHLVIPEGIGSQGECKSCLECGAEL